VFKRPFVQIGLGIGVGAIAVGTLYLAIESGLSLKGLGAMLGFDTVIATCQNRTGGRYTAAIVGENCYGRAKLARIQRWLDSPDGNRDRQHIRFYSDHASDEPVLRWADSAHVVNPSRKLAELARQEGWRELRFR